MFKKLACVAMAVVMTLVFVACGKNSDADSDSKVELSTETMVQSLESMTTELEAQMKDSDPDADVMLVVAEDGSCKLLVRNEAEEVELELNTAESIEAMFKLYMDAGFLSETGELLGFPEIPSVDEDESVASVSDNASSVSQEEILAMTDLNGEDSQIAGFPGEGTIDAGEVEMDLGGDAEVADESVSGLASE